MKASLLTFLLLSCHFFAFAQTDSVRSYTTRQLIGDAPKIDGFINDPAWDQVPWSTEDFIQREPAAGKAPSVQTRFKILYDAKNLYVAFKNLDPEPAKIVKRMSRRDGFDGDFVEINIDSYFDKRTAFSFTSSVSGVKGDEYVSNDGNDWDASWDPIWYMKTSINEEGWIAELRIPLSQLRFADKEEHTWGINITRHFFRNQERSNWQYIAPDAPGWVHLFGELRGIKGIKPQKQLEVQPYIVAKTETFQKEEGNPYVTGKSSRLDAGLDAKIGITSDITLDLTVNPDFGQVEADPSQVNLSAFRLFFQEQRPFFIEGSNTLNFPITDFDSNNLFYSRRVGRQPQNTPDTDPDGDDHVNEYVKKNNHTTILGAAKLTGKNKHGFSWGILESVTAKETTEIDSLGSKRNETIEPLTNYFVARAQQDINQGNTIVGGMFTATNRDIQDPQLLWLHKQAYSGGADFIHHWRDRKYYVSLKTLFSHVKGDPQAITATQHASERYFQRPDNKHANVDSSRTSLSGTGGTFVGGRKSGSFVYEIGYTWMSPQLELNDIGFLSQTNTMGQWIWVQYRKLTPFSIFRAFRQNFTQYQNWDFDGESMNRGYEIFTRAEFKNFWIAGLGGNYETHAVSNADLRGGPAIHYPGTLSFWTWVMTDNRKKFQVFLNPQYNVGFDNYKRSITLDLEFNFRPTNALAISIAPSFQKNNNKLQYVSTVSSTGADRHIVGEIDQTIARVSLRMTYMITPNLSIQYWGQPFGTSGKYSNFKKITDADANEYDHRYSLIGNDKIQLNEESYVVDDENGNFEFENPNFNFGQFRSNMVLRWEYIPGSTLFLVWTQEMNGAFYDTTTDRHRRYSFDFQDRAHNIFLLKYTYRFIL
ncbi:DUF5916 domain-containing protein [Pseudochryseolinea flava]|uniref:Hydrolase n=1 Tax=Pseudochryseolinea flava TaxID=2059302 RepID=A0A364Y0L8_9BACT|nr:DUF5916 domain-containing protein [Pseudochryseolinea flava]RAW00334.1 hypothetical protein DQQ10_14875 [Pseudochryseolinea flava]